MNKLWTCGRTCLRYKVIDLPFREMGWLLEYCESHWDSLPFQKYSVSLNRIVPTQGEIFTRVLARYVHQKRLVDSQNHLPYAVRLADDPTIYLLDGHHRWCAARIKKRKALRLLIVDLDLQPVETHLVKEFAF